MRETELEKRKRGEEDSWGGEFRNICASFARRLSQWLDEWRREEFVIPILEKPRVVSRQMNIRGGWVTVFPKSWTTVPIVVATSNHRKAPSQCTEAW